MNAGGAAHRIGRAVCGLALAGLLAGGLPRALLAQPAAGEAAHAPADDPPQPPEPHRRSGSQALDFRGPGRDAPEPAVDEVVLGWFGPGDPDHQEFGDLWRGAVLALEHENAAGGYKGKPFRLLPVWSESPWKAGVVAVNRLVYERGAWAILGGVDGASTHLAVQLALKSFFPLLSPGSTDATADHANVPWLFSLPPSDDSLAPVVAGSAAEAAAGGTLAVVAGTDHDSHATLRSVRRALAARRLVPSALHELPEDEPDLPTTARRVLAAAPKAVLVLARAPLAGRFVCELRAGGYGGALVGGPTLGRRAFARAAGAAAEGLVAPHWISESRPEWSAFEDAYRRRWSEPPDAAAGHGYDAVRITAAAIRSAGLNRARIRDAVRALAPWSGAAGDVRWNPRGRNEPPIRAGRWRGGRLDSLVPLVRGDRSGVLDRD